jgi:hypothetical protein
VGRVDIAVQCMVVNSNWKRVRVKMDLVAPWIAMGALKCSELSMMRVMEVSKGHLTQHKALSEAIVREKR